MPLGARLTAFLRHKTKVRWLLIGLGLGLGIFLSIPPRLMEDVSFSRMLLDRNGVLLRLALSKDDAYRLFVPLDRISPLQIGRAHV